MLRMSKKRPKPKQVRKGTNLNVWLNEELMAAFNLLIGQTRRTLTAETELMMESHLRANGLWPPKPKETS